MVNFSSVTISLAMAQFPNLSGIYAELKQLIHFSSNGVNTVIPNGGELSTSLLSLLTLILCPCFIIFVPIAHRLVKIVYN
ncbi:hypothetical protein CR513_38103, partial [Mucuna pruriens]